MHGILGLKKNSVRCVVFPFVARTLMRLSSVVLRRIETYGASGRDDCNWQKKSESTKH